MQANYITIVHKQIVKKRRLRCKSHFLPWEFVAKIADVNRASMQA